jgi:hypothetical protein
MSEAARGAIAQGHAYARTRLACFRLALGTGGTIAIPGTPQ